MADYRKLMKIGLWHQYKTPFVRDLAWVLLSPPLIIPTFYEINHKKHRPETREPITNKTYKIEPASTFLAQESKIVNTTEAIWPQIQLIDSKEKILSWLEQLDAKYSMTKSPQSSSTGQEAPPSPQSYKRLGLYFEALLKFYFTQGWHEGVSPYQLIANNIQVHKNGKTIGEFDFILRGPDNRIIHLEAAIKFYLFDSSNNVEQLTEREKWRFCIGPNAKDRLDLKFIRMLEHQLCLSQHPAAIKVLKDFKVTPEAVEPCYLMAGQLFLPNEVKYLKQHSRQTTQESLPSAQPSPLPQSINVEAIRGYWLNKTDAIAQLQDNNKNTLWYPLSKTQWMTGLHNTLDDSQAFTSSQLLETLNQPHAEHSNRYQYSVLPLHLIKKERDGICTPIMIVSDHWPSTTSSI